MLFWSPRPTMSIFSEPEWNSVSGPQMRLLQTRLGREAVLGLPPAHWDTCKPPKARLKPSRDALNLFPSGKPVFFTLFLAGYSSVDVVTKHINSFKSDDFSSWKRQFIALSYLNPEYTAEFSQTYTESATLPIVCVKSICYIFPVTRACWFICFSGLRFNVCAICPTNIYLQSIMMNLYLLE